MSGAFSNDSIQHALQSVFNKKLKEIIIDISEKYNIDKDKLISDYISIDNVTETYEHSNSTKYDSVLDCDSQQSIHKITKNKTKKTQLSSSEICVARKADGQRCTRKRRDKLEYCGKHSSHLKYGRADDTKPTETDEKYVMTWHECIDGSDYLVDNQNVVYTYNLENPEIVGKKNSEGKLVLLDEMQIS
jgi:hypothetical protein